MDFYQFSQILEQNTLHKTTLRCGDTLHVLVASTEEELKRMVDDKKKKLLKANGPEVTDADGNSVWISDEEEYPYVWHKDGNRVQARRMQVEKNKDGTITKSLIKKIWTKIDDQ